MRLVSLAALALFLIASPAAADANGATGPQSLVTSGIGLNFIGVGQCLVVNSDAWDHDLVVHIVNGTTGDIVAGGPITAAAGLITIVTYQATHADRRDYFCALSVPPPVAYTIETCIDCNGYSVLSGGIRMSFRRRDFSGNVSDESDGLPVIPGNGSENDDID